MNIASGTLKSPEAKRFLGFFLFLSFVRKLDFESVFEENRGGKPVFYTKVCDDGVEEILDDLWVDFADEFLIVHEPFVLKLLAQDEVAVCPSVEGIGEHRADGGGIPRFAGSGAYALLVERLGNCTTRSFVLSAVASSVKGVRRDDLPVCGEKLRPNKGWAAMFYDGYCNTCDMPVENGEEDEDCEENQID